MPNFASLQELLSLLHTERKLINALFERRNSSLAEQSDALSEWVNNDSDRIQRLIQGGILVQRGRSLQLDDRLLSFVETFLGVDQEIGIAQLQEDWEHLQNAISYYKVSRQALSQQTYLQQIKRSLQRIDHTLGRLMPTLSRNVKHVHQTEAKQLIKQKKLKNYQEKGKQLEAFVHQLHTFINQEAFFNILMDHELEILVYDLLDHIRQVRIYLTDIQQQIMQYLGRLSQSSALYEKVQRLKYLKDQFELREKSNIQELLQKEDTMLFQQKWTTNLPLSLSFFETDAASPILRKVAHKLGYSPYKRAELAEKIDEGYLQEETEQSYLPDLPTLHSLFLTSGEDLFSFLMEVDMISELPFSDKVRIFCLFISQYEGDLLIQDEFGEWEGIEYVKVSAKTNP